jgi:hypothetical protein
MLRECLGALLGCKVPYLVDKKISTNIKTGRSYESNFSSEPEKWLLAETE